MKSTTTTPHPQSMKTSPATYPTKQAAQDIIAGLDSATYYLAHGEYARPHYTARKVRGESAYYIHAKRYYYAGTVNQRPSGPLDERCNELFAGLA